jgi:hypothetical protein
VVYDVTYSIKYGSRVFTYRAEILSKGDETELHNDASKEEDDPHGCC